MSNSYVLKGVDNMSLRLITTLSFIFASAAALLTAAQSEAMTIDLDPAIVEISTFYNGGDVKISGKVPADADVLVRLSGEPHEVTMKKKGKVSGLLWMNVAEVTFENVPSAYLLYTSEGSPGKLNDMWDDFGLGFGAVKKQMQVKPAGDKNSDFNDFMKLKRKENLYNLAPGVVRFGEKAGTMKPFTACIHLPPRLQQGKYKIDVVAVNGNGIVDKKSKELRLKQSGFPAFLSKMAFDRALLYGILAVFSAILAGLGMSIIFKDKGGAH